MFSRHGSNAGLFPGQDSLDDGASGSSSGKSKKPILRTLEPRMVFDAAAGATAHQALAPAHAEPSGDAGHSSPAEPAWSHLAEALKATPVAPTDKPADAKGPASTEPVVTDPRTSDTTNPDFTAVAGSDKAVGKEVVFVWDNVQDWQTIVKNLGDKAEVHVLDSSKDGVAQVADILKNQSDISAIHLISHGVEGSLNLGTAVLDADSMRDQYRDDLTAIGHAMSENGDILIYGCDFAAGADGREATAVLSGITQADIAASTDPTGAFARGGDWDLEQRTGAIEARVFVDDHYDALLSAPNIDLDGLSGSTSNFTTSYTENGSAVAIVATGVTGATVSDADSDLTRITITANAAPSANAEHLSFNGLSVGMGSDSSSTVIVGATTYRVDFTAATRTFVITNNAGGILSVSANNNALLRSITYDNTSDNPTNGGASTQRVFSFSATDQTAVTSAVRTATVAITAANDAPVNTLPASGWTTNEDTAVQLTGLQVADADAGAGTIVVTLSVATGTINATSNGGVTIGGTAAERTLTGTVANINAYLASGSAPTYTPVADANGSVTLTMSTNDNGNSGGSAMTDTDTAPITITAVNDAPLGVNDSKTVNEDTPATGNVLTNDTDADGNSLTVTQFIVGGATYTAGQTATLTGVGTLVIRTNGTYTFTPVANYNGSVPGATYTLSDGSLTSTATLAITLTPVNDAPVDGNETNNVTEDTTLTVANGAIGDLLNNATDVDGNTLTISAFSVANQGGPFVVGTAYAIAGVGSVTIRANGSYTFTPAANYVGAVPVITYTVSDGASGTNTSTLTLTILPANDAPQGTDNTVTINEDTAYTFSVASFGFSDPNDTPANVMQSVIITTLPSVAEGTLLLSGAAVAPGQVIAAADIPNLTFEPADDVNGTSVGAFTFQVVDDGGLANGGQNTDQTPNTFAFNITALNDTPVAVDDLATTPEETTLSVDATSGLLSNDTDVDGDALVITQFAVSGITATAGQTGTIPGVGTLTVNADGSYTFAPVANFIGPVPDVTYTVTDGNGGTTTGVLTIIVTPVNDLPVDGDETNTVTEDTTLTVADGSSGDLLNNSSDLDGDTLTIDSFSIDGEAGPFAVGSPYVITGVGALTISANGSYSFVPAPDFDGTIPQITYTVSDGNGGTNDSTLTLTMVPVNDAPIGNDDSASTPENTPVSGNVLTNDTDVDSTTLTVVIFEFGGTTYGAGTPATIDGVGTLVINTDGSYTFTPAPSYDGPVPDATYRVTDGALNDTAVLHLTITPLNDPPVADDETGTTPEDTTLSVPASSGLLVGDTDVDGDPLEITEFTIDGDPYLAGETASVAAGDLTIYADGSYTFVPASNYNGPVPVATYTVSDDSGATDEGTLTLTVTPVNDDPVTVDDIDDTLEDTPLSGDVLANDSDVDGDDLTIIGFQVDGVPGSYIAGSTATIPGVGTVTINDDGTYVLVPAANYTGDVPEITYIVSDGNGGVVTGTLTLDVLPVNDPPVANDDTATTTVDTDVSGNVLANDTDVEGDDLTVTGFDVDGTHYDPGDTANIDNVGSLTMDDEGNYTFTPEAGYTGPVPDVTYTVSDGTDSSDGTLTINVVPENLVGAVNDVATTPEDTPLTGGNVLTNDVDPEGDDLTVDSFTVAGAPTVYQAGDTADIDGVGMLTIQADGTYTFIPEANYYGPVPVATYTATDGVLFDTATLTITVTPVNDPVTAVNDTGTTPEDTALAGNVLTNDSYVEGPLSVTGFVILGVNYNSGQTATIPTVGRLTINANGSYSFVPNANYDGAVPVVTYTVEDGDGSTATATLVITITSVNDAPVATDDTGTTLEDTTLTVMPTGGLLSNDQDVEGTTLTITEFTVAGLTGTFLAGETAAITGFGDLTINDDGSYTFVPAANYFGPVPAATYTVSDGVLTDTATLSITVTSDNDIPVAVNDTGTLAEDTTLTVPAASGLLSNDTDADGTPLSVIRFTVNGIVIAVNTTVPIPGVGSLRINSDGSYSFTPVANYNGTVPAITYTVSDGNGGTATATLTIVVTPVNDAPDAVNDSATTREDTTLTVTAAGGLLANDTDIDGTDTLLVTGFSFGGNFSAGQTATIAGVGSLTVNSDGSYTFVPAANYNGPVPVATYTISDGNGGVDTANLTIDITPVNDAPIAVNDSVSTNEDTTLTVPAPGLLSNDSDLEGDPLVIQGFTVAGISGGFLAGATATINNVGTLRINADGSYVFVPVANYNGPGPVATYRVTDGALTSTAVLTITVIPVNDAPVDGNETRSVTEDTTLNVVAGSGLLANTTDIDGGAPRISAFTVGIEPGPFVVGTGYVISGVGTITIRADGSYTFVPLANYAGTIPVITYTVSDGAGGENTSTLTLNMVAVNDPPVDGNETRSVTEDTTLSVPAATGLLANATDIDGGALSVTQFLIAGDATIHAAGDTVTLSGVGTITIRADGSYTFVPAANYTGAIPVITYTVSDGATGTDTSTLTLTMVAVNDPPVGIDDTATTPEDTTLTGNVLTNDTDVDGAFLRVAQFLVDGTTYTAGQTATITGVGTLIIRADGSYTFVPVANYNGSVPVATYRVSDGRGGTDTATLTITVTPVNDPPADGNETNTVTEDTTLTVPVATGLLANATDIDGGTLSVTQFTIAGDATIHNAGDSVTITGVGTITIRADGSYTFVPAANFNGAVPVITYTVSDGASGTDMSTLTITVTPVNDAPAATDDNGTTPEDTTLTGNVLTNDTDVDGAFLRVAQFVVDGVTYTAGSTATITGVGTLTINANGSYTFVPAANYNGPVPVATYRVSDGRGGTDTGTLTITVTPVNDAPVDGNETRFVTEDTTLAVPAATGLLANATDIDGGALSVTQFVVRGVTYTAGTTATITGVGTLTVRADGSYTFVPAANYAGSIPLITYTVSDGASGTDTSTLTLAMVPVNDPPVDGNETRSVTEDTTLTVPASTGLLANATDIDGGTLSVTRFVISGVTYTAGATATVTGVGTLTIRTDGSYTFVPATNYAGAIPLVTYTVSDGRGGIDISTLTLTMVPVNDAPVATDDTGTTLEDTTLTGNVLTNDTDIDGGALSVTRFVVGGTTYTAGATATITGIGTLTINANGGYTFVPVANYNGPGPIATYTVSDGRGGADTATLTIAVTPVNDAPVATDDTGTTLEDTTLTGNVLTNDTDIDGGFLRVAQFVVGGTTYTAGSTATITGVGTLTINANGSYVFVPVADYNGSVPVATYRVSDGRGGTDTATLTITVTPVNDAPVAADDTGATPEDTALTGNVLTNDTDVDGGLLRVTRFVVDGTTYTVGSTATINGVGALTLRADGTYTFVPAADYNGSVPTATYTVSDGRGGTDTATLTITVTPVNDAPVATDDTGTTPEDTTLTGNVLTNDADIDGGFLRVAQFVVEGTTYAAGQTAALTGVGALTINANGSYVFVPSADYSGPVPVAIYRVSDGRGGTDTATLTLTVTPVNDAPVAIDDTGAAPEDTTLNGNVLANDSDVDGGLLRVIRFVVDGTSYTVGSTATLSGIGALTINANGSYVFVPSANYNGPVPIATYTVSDGRGGTDIGTLTLTVTPVNDAPVATDDTGTTPEDTTLTGNVLANDTDIDGGLLRVVQFAVDGTIYTSGQTATLTGIGTLTINVNGSYVFVPVADYNGPVPIATYRVSDGRGGTDTATLTLTVTPVNDAPAATNDTGTTPEDTPLTGNVLANDTDIDGGLLRVTQFAVDGTIYTSGQTATLTGIGTLTINANGSYVFVPVADYNGPVPIATYRVSDSRGGADTATLTLIVTPVNDAPVATNDTGTTPEDTTLNGNILSNDTDIDGGLLRVAQFVVDGTIYTAGQTATIAGVGTLTLKANGSYTLVPVADYSGPVPVVTYRISDGRGGADTATLTLTVTPVDDPPVDRNETNAVTEDTTLTVPAATGLLANANDIDGGALSVTQFVVRGTSYAAGDTATIPGVGAITIRADGSYIYTPAADYAGSIPVVTYTVSDGRGGIDTSRLTLTMVPVNDPPLASDDTGTTAEDTPLNGNVLSNDTDIDGGALSVTQFVVDGTTYTAGQTVMITGVGSLRINADGSYRFVPVANYNGPGPLTSYTVSDGNGGTDTATLVITVTPVNDAPDPDEGDGIDTDGDGDGDGDGTDIPDQTSVDAATVATVDVSGYFFDVDGDVLSYTVSGLPAGLSIDPVTGVISGTLPNDASQGGPYTVVVTATDPSGLSAIQTFGWSVINPAPIAGDDTAVVPEDSVLTGSVIANDSDPDGDTLSITQFVVSGTTYAAGQTAVLAGMGSLVISADGSYTFIPAPNYNGPVPAATYTLSDGNGGSDIGTLTIRVAPVDDVPDIVDDQANGDQDTTITGNVLDNDSDPEGDPLLVTGFTVDGASTVYRPGDTATILGVGTISLEPNGDFRFIPAPGYYGEVPDIVYTASDGNGGTGNAKLHITVTPVDNFVPTPDDKDPDLPDEPDEPYDPDPVDGAVIAAVRGIDGLLDIAGLGAQPIDAIINNLDLAPRFSLHSFLGGSSSLAFDSGVAGGEKIHVEAVKHAGILYLQVIEKMQDGDEKSVLSYRLRAADGSRTSSWLKQVGPLTFAGQPDANTGSVDLILSIVQRDGRVTEHELRLDTTTGHLSQVPAVERHGFEGRLAPTFSQQMNEGSPSQNINRLERALGFNSPLNGEFGAF